MRMDNFIYSVKHHVIIFVNLLIWYLLGYLKINVLIKS